MPKIYEYFGLIILFYSNEHEPVHVHGKYQGTESKAEFFIANGVIIEIEYSSVRGRQPLPRTQMKDFRTLVEKYSEDILQKWIDYFVLHKQITPQKITRRIR